MQPTSLAERRELHQLTGAFIHNLLPWTWIATLTFDDPVSRVTAASAVARWLRYLARTVLRTHVTAVWVAERGASNLLHVHAVLHADGRMNLPSAEALSGTWRDGFACIEKFRAELGGAWYMVEDILTVGDADWNISVGCDRRPGCRRKGCTLLRRLATAVGHVDHGAKKTPKLTTGLAHGAAV
jgi:hypothetical protein